MTPRGFFITPSPFSNTSRGSRETSKGVIRDPRRGYSQPPGGIARLPSASRKTSGGSRKWTRGSRITPCCHVKEVRHHLKMARLTCSRGVRPSRAIVRYDLLVPRPLFVLSGIGGDERLFDAQRAVRDIRPIRWILPADPREPLSEYAARLARQLAIGEPFDVGGSSFGGMIALELARHLSPRQVFLFGSCRSPDAIAPSLRALRLLAAISPDRLLHPPRMLQPLLAGWFGATSPAHVDLFARMLATTPPAFIRWAARAVFSWPGVAGLPMPIHHVHGDRDRLISVDRVKPDRVIGGAGHLLNLTHAEAVNEFIASRSSTPSR